MAWTMPGTLHPSFQLTICTFGLGVIPHWSPWQTRYFRLRCVKIIYLILLAEQRIQLRFVRTEICLRRYEITQRSPSVAQVRFFRFRIIVGHEAASHRAAEQSSEPDDHHQSKPVFSGTINELTGD
jgi:hypothetical protein